MSNVEDPYRWAVLRPNPKTGEPLGALKVEVVPAAAFDAMRADRDRLLAMLKRQNDALTAVFSRVQGVIVADDEVAPQAHAD